MNTYHPSWADYDNDGDLDLFVPVGLPSENNLTLKNVLYKNNCNGEFTRILALPEGVVTDEGGSSHFGIWGDADNDGDLDLYVTNNKTDDENYYYLNNGDGTFTANTTDVIATDKEASRGACWLILIMMVILIYLFQTEI